MTPKCLVRDCPRFAKGSQKKDWILGKHAPGFKLPVRCQVCKREAGVRHCSLKKQERSSRADKNSQLSPAGGGGSPGRLCEPAGHGTCSRWLACSLSPNCAVIQNVSTHFGVTLASLPAIPSIHQNAFLLFFFPFPAHFCHVNSPSPPPLAQGDHSLQSTEEGQEKFRRTHHDTDKASQTEGRMVIGPLQKLIHPPFLKLRLFKDEDLF